MTDHNSSTESVRLNKYIAGALAMGRRQVDYLIEKGKIKVNGVVPSLGARVHSSDLIIVNGKALGLQAKPLTYLALNKPEGYICSRRQQSETPTIYALLPQEYQHLKPVGRLDKDSSGLLLMTNDGDFTHQMTHPSFIKVKHYDVTLDEPLQPLHHQMISNIGVTLPDGVSKLSLQRITVGDDTRWTVIMHEGRNRQIRRTFAALGYGVVALHRTNFGPYALNSLKPGRFELIKL
jgi:23S rRNA pseudouridine2605 synthase